MEEEFIFLEYNTITGDVFATHKIEPTLSHSEHGSCKSKTHQLGDEFEYSLKVLSVGGDGYLEDYSGVRNNPQANRLLQENTDLKKRLQLSEQVLDFLIMNGGML